MTDRSEHAFTVMTYNVGNGLMAPDRLCAFLRSSSADVVGLQEVDAAQAAMLERESAAFPYQVVRGTGFSGRALLSRHPVLAQEWLDFSPDRPDLRVVVDLFGTRTTIVVAHPPPPTLQLRGVVFDAETIAQIDQLATIVVTAAPAVMLGDFNMTSRHPSHARLLAAGLVDAHLAVKALRGATFPLRPGRIRRGNHRLSWVPLLPIARVDYIWHTPDLITLRTWVGPRGDSDHRPVLAQLVGTNGDARAS